MRKCLKLPHFIYISYISQVFQSKGPWLYNILPLKTLIFYWTKRLLFVWCITTFLRCFKNQKQQLFSVSLHYWKFMSRCSKITPLRRNQEDISFQHMQSKQNFLNTHRPHNESMAFHSTDFLMAQLLIESKLKAI